MDFRVNKTLYITDLDGTLLSSTRQISEYTSKCLNKLIESGMSFSIATARTPATVEELVVDINVNVPVVLMNGAVIYDLSTHRYLDIAYISQSILQEVKSALVDYLSEAFIYTISNDKLEVYYTEPMNKAQYTFYEERKDKKQKRFVCSELVDETKVIYFVFMDSQEKIKVIYEAIKDIKGLALAMYKDIYSEDTYLLEVYSQEATKANGVLKIKEQFGYKKVICFGDNMNDLSMFNVADESYAMDNAVDELKEIATGIIKSNDDDGVARYIKEHY